MKQLLILGHLMILVCIKLSGQTTTIIREPVRPPPGSTTVAQPAPTSGQNIDKNTLQDMLKRIAELENTVAALNKKLAYQGMTIMTVEGGASEMIPQYENNDDSYYHMGYKIKINNPLCNNNPNAIIVAMNQSTWSNAITPSKTVYNSSDNAWYILLPGLELTRLEKIKVENIGRNSIELVAAEGTEGLISARKVVPSNFKFSVIIFNK